VVHRNLLKRFILPVQAISLVVADGGEDLEQLELQELPLKAQPQEDNWATELAEGANLTENQKRELVGLLEKHKETFSDEPGLTQETEFTVNTGEARPVASYPYTVPLKWKEMHREAIQDMVKKGLLVESKSPWASPTHCVPKPDGTLRVVGDYRKINQVTLGDVFPLPRMDQLLEKVATARYISTIDLSKGYLQIPVKAEDQEKTAIITEYGKFQYTRMPFGMKGAPACFQRMVNNFLQGVPNASAYINDIVIYNDEWQQHWRGCWKF